MQMQRVKTTPQKYKAPSINHGGFQFTEYEKIRQQITFTTRQK
jgi:hypothetical protein